MAKGINLSNGQVAVVDDEDYEALKMFKWHARYNEHTKSFYARRGARVAERRAGKPRMIYMHREIMGAPAGREVDHKNHDTLDNRRDNLRLATVSQNHQNRNVFGGSSQYKGVSRYSGRNRWAARIKIAGKDIRIGSFPSEIDAARAYNAAAIKYFGEFARLNDV